jgi:magnesium chelatase family protein
MSSKDIETYIILDPQTKTLASMYAEKMNLSPRAYHKVLKVARTIADIEGSEGVQQEHILEAFQYRPKV